MKIVTNEQMSALDQSTIKDYNIPGILLMEHASLALMKEAVRFSRNRKINRFLICCGPGNNGGDGLALARHLIRQQKEVHLFLFSTPDKLRDECLENYKMLTRQTEYVYWLKGNQDIDKKALLKLLKEKMVKQTVVVDALFGTGLDRLVDGIFSQAIDKINQSDCPVISVDIPSGIQGNTGRVLGNSVKADITVSFQLPKAGNVLYPGAACNGILKIADIGIPNKLIENTSYLAMKTESKHIKEWVRCCQKNDHKGHGGTILVLAGTKGMTGAAVLAAKAAFRSGAGLVRIACEEQLNCIYEQMFPEATTIAYSVNEYGYLTCEAKKCLEEQISIADAIIAGPGWGKSKSRADYLEFLLDVSEKPMVLDADALNLLSENQRLFLHKKSPWIMTPHPGEMARLTGLSAEDVNSNRIEITKKYAEKWQSTILLKGAGTVISDHHGEVWINTTGNPGMATGGSGDVLTGIIASLYHRTNTAIHAATAAAYLHGVSGDMAASCGMTGTIASDLIDFLPKAFKKIIE